MGELEFAIASAVTHQNIAGQGRRSVIPAPVAGWNTQDPEAAMRPEFAVSMENYFPERGRVVSRQRDQALTPRRAHPATWKRCSTGSVEPTTSYLPSPILSYST